MAEACLPRGLIIDMITPLEKGGEIDGRGLGRHLDRVIPHAQALFIAGPHMGNGRSLGQKLLKSLFEKVLVVVRGLIPVMVWISRETEEKTVETLLLLRRILKSREYSGPVFWVDTPLYYHSNRGLIRHCERLSSLAQEPFILHNDPDLIKTTDRPFKRSNIRTSILKELVQMDSMKGLIFSGSLERAYNYQKAVRSRSDFRIYDGDESRFLKHPSLSGVVSGGANLAPRAWQKITASSLDLNGGHKDYPDHLKQIWETGRYLNNLKDVYQEHGNRLITQVLFDRGVLSAPEDAASGSVDPENAVAGSMEEERKALSDLMEQYADYS